MDLKSKIYIAGHHGMAGLAKRKLESKSYNNFIFRTHSELDLTNQQAVNDFFEQKT
jgi:GDP-L-fucose synthase